VGPVGVEVIDVLINDRSQVPFTGDEHPVLALAAGAGDPVPLEY
jgi:hypothetical protein